MDRMPASINRLRTHHGVGAVGSTPVIRRATNRGQSSSLSTVIGYAVPSASGVSMAAGSR
jgi:hypothetical protein